MAGPGDAFDLAAAYLDVCAEALDTIPDFEPDLLGAPDRQFVSPGQPVFDCCDQLAVEMTIVNDADTTPGGLAAGKRALMGRIPHVTLTAWATRCIPSILDNGMGSVVIPTPEELTASARQLDTDAWALYNHVYNAIRAEEFLTLCGEAFFVGVVPVLPSGGCGGWTVTIRASLDGYAESASS